MKAKITLQEQSAGFEIYPETPEETELVAQFADLLDSRKNKTRAKVVTGFNTSGPTPPQPACSFTIQIIPQKRTRKPKSS